LPRRRRRRARPPPRRSRGTVTKRGANRRAKLSFNEQRELDGIEAKIEAAETEAAKAEASMGDARGRAVGEGSLEDDRGVPGAWRSRRPRSRGLYDRWDELESKRARLAAGESA
jgi:hypothetical protein